MAREIIPLPSSEYLRECFLYDPVTGTLTWRERPRRHFTRDWSWRSWNTQHAGKTIKCLSTEGYVKLKLNYVTLRAHRIIWKLMTECEPPPELDHRDRKRSNNGFDNLRTATRTEQHKNKSVKITSTTGYKGVYFSRTGHPRTLRYRAAIRVDGCDIHLGYFMTAEEAHDAYCAAAHKYFGEFWCAG